MSGNDKIKRTAGWTMSGLLIAFMVMDAGMKLVPMQVVIETTADLGYSTSLGMVRGLGILGLVCTALYALPRTAVLGAILLTGYMGGAVATHVRLGSPLFSHILFGFYLGLFAWGGLYLRDPRIRAILPFRTTPAQSE
jgi:hypothetical protein